MSKQITGPPGRTEAERITLYLDAAAKRRIRTDAAKAGLSMSAYLLGLAARPWRKAPWVANTPSAPGGYAACAECGETVLLGGPGGRGALDCAVRRHSCHTRP